MHYIFISMKFIISQNASSLYIKFKVLNKIVFTLLHEIESAPICVILSFQTHIHRLFSVV